MRDTDERLVVFPSDIGFLFPAAVHTHHNGVDVPLHALFHDFLGTGVQFRGQHTIPPHGQPVQTFTGWAKISGATRCNSTYNLSPAFIEPLVGRLDNPAFEQQAAFADVVRYSCDIIYAKVNGNNRIFGVTLILLRRLASGQLKQ